MGNPIGDDGGSQFSTTTNALIPLPTPPWPWNCGRLLSTVSHHGLIEDHHSAIPMKASRSRQAERTGQQTQSSPSPFPCDSDSSHLQIESQDLWHSSLCHGEDAGHSLSHSELEGTSSADIVGEGITSTKPGVLPLRPGA